MFLLLVPPEGKSFGNRVNQPFMKNTPIYTIPSSALLCITHPDIHFQLNSIIISVLTADLDGNDRRTDVLIVKIVCFTSYGSRGEDRIIAIMKALKGIIAGIPR